jgi:TolB protein
VLRFSPDGSRLLIYSDAGISKRETFVGFRMIQLPDGAPRRVLASLRGQAAGLRFSWLPDSRHIVVVRTDGPSSGMHLWLADIETDTSRPLTVTNSNESSPAVSPDGSRIVFTSEATNFDLMLVPLDGSPLRPFLSSTRNELDPVWSRTAAQYAFVTDRTGSQEIWLRSEQDNWERALVVDADFAGLSPTLLFSALALSPDGRRLAYQRIGRSEVGEIWISTLAGGQPIRLLGPAAAYQDAPTWSPDGDWLAFVISPGPDQWSLAKARVGGANAAPVILKEGILPQTRPQWSPDGQWILCDTADGLMLIASDEKLARQNRILNDNDWLAYVWAADSRQMYGLQLSDDRRHFRLVSVDIRTRKEQIVAGDLGTVAIAQQPIRGLSRMRDAALITSIAQPRSDIWLLDGFGPPPRLLARFWPWRGRVLN